MVLALRFLLLLSHDLNIKPFARPILVGILGVEVSIAGLDTRLVNFLIESRCTTPAAVCRRRIAFNISGTGAGARYSGKALNFWQRVALQIFLSAANITESGI